MRFVQRSLCSAALGLVLLSAAGAASAAPAIVEYPVAPLDTGPATIVAGPGGRLWFSETATSQLGVASFAGKVSQVPGLSGPALGVAIGTDGNVWVTEPQAGELARVTPRHVVTQYPLAAGSVPEQIAAGPDGDLWFTESATPAQIGRVNPTTGVITRFSTGMAPGGAPLGIAAGPDGNLWFTEAADPGRIGMITPAGAITEFPTPTVNSDPTSITAGPDGNLWFTEAADPGRIGMITPAGAITEFPTPTVNSDPTSITAGPDGNLWFTEAADPGRIGMITPAGAITEFPTPTVNSDPTSITAGPDARLWFTESGAHGLLGAMRVSPTPTPTPPTPTPPTPTPPTVSLSPAGEIGPTSVTLAGLIDPNGTATAYHFVWGPSIGYGQSSPSPAGMVGSDNTEHAVTQTLTGLMPGTLYHYRLVASNCGACASGTTEGPDATFVTQSTTLTIGPSNPLGAAPAAPALGHTAAAAVVSGTILVRVPGSSELTRLSAGRDIPLGSLVDASRGTVRLTTALNAHGRTQSATAWGGDFIFRQVPGRGMTTFTLAGALSCPARRHSTEVAAAVPGTRAARGKPTRRLWSSDNHGQYSTRGQNSVATVRGTVWETVDSCGGTLTFVKRGRVSVRDLRHHRTVLVTAGHRYLARS